jgi:hypothetical protein
VAKHCTAATLFHANNTQLQGYNAQKASFSSTILVKQIGHALYSLTPSGSQEKETYLITLPNLHIASLIYGSPFVELEKSSKIVSSSGYTAKIDFSGKGWLSGKKNTFTASLYQTAEGEKKPLYTVDGQWSDKFNIKDARSKDVIDSWSAKDNQTTPLTLAPLEQQDLYESRRAWSDVATNIQKGDMDAVSGYKSCIENAQRELRRVEKEEGREWERRFFTRIESEDALVQGLAKEADLVFEADKTGGIWRFDGKKAEGAQPPYHKVGPEGLGLTE